MALKLGNTDINDLKHGTTQVQKVYAGANQVWPLGEVYSLTNSLETSLISDQQNNMLRNNNLLITAHNASSKYIDIDYAVFTLLDSILYNSTSKSWFICQGSEASILVDVVSVDTVAVGSEIVATLRIYYGTTYNGTPNFNVGQKIELLNPFINYSIIPAERPLFSPYPTTVGGSSFNYIQPGGVFQKSNGTYVLMCPVVFGSHASRDIYYATSTDAENWTFQNTKILDTSSIPFAKTNGNVFSTGNPYKLPSGEWLFLLAVERSNGNYTGAYMVMNDNMVITTSPTLIGFDSWNSSTKNYFPLAMTYYNGRYRIFVHDRSNNIDINKSSVEYTFTSAESEANIFSILNGNTSYTSKVTVYDANNDDGYLNGKVDDITYVNDGNDLNILIGGEEENVGGWVTSNNREYGLAKLSGNTTWVNDKRSPLIVTPMQFFRKYPNLSFFWDHIGGFISPLVKDGKMYIYFAAGTNNPDYYLAGMKINLTQ